MAVNVLLTREQAARMMYKRDPNLAWHTYKEIVEFLTGECGAQNVGVSNRTTGKFYVVTFETDTQAVEFKLKWL